VRKLFLRIYLGTLLALLVGLVSAELLLTHPYNVLQKNEHRDYIGIVHPLIVEQLEASPAEQWRGILDRWEGITEYELSLSTSLEPREVGASPTELEIEFSSNYLTDYLSSFVPVSGTNQTLHYYQESTWEATYLLMEYLSQVIVFAAIAIMTYLLIRPLYRSTQELSATAKQFAQGNLSERVSVRGNGPFAELSRQFNRMASEIQQKIAEQKITTDAISHELKTPMTRLRLALDMARASDDETEVRELLEKMDEDLNDMNGLSSQLLTLAKLTYKSETPDFEKVLVANLIEREIIKISDFKPQVDLSLVGDRSLSIQGHEVSLALLFHNLLINAQRYATQAVRVEMKAENDVLVVSVEDDGPGIPIEKREDVFAPFSRIDGSRNRSTGGYGLGLAIVLQSVEEHGGSVRIDESPLGGALFTLRLPRGTQSQPKASRVIPRAHRPRTTAAVNA